MHSFKTYLKEGYAQRGVNTLLEAQQGYAYEVNAANALKPFDIVPANFTPAGAGSNKPDLMIQKPGGKPVGCELKIMPTSAGSLTLLRKNGTWKLGKTFKLIDGKEVELEEKVLMREIAEKYNILTTINKGWKADSEKYDIKDSELSKQERYEKDKATFKSIYGEITPTDITDYYGKKYTYYFNIGTRGLFIGSSNPLNLKGVPKFKDNATCKYRARIHAKGKDKNGEENYTFTLVLKFYIGTKKKSKYNIAPLGSGVQIDTKSKIFKETLKDLFGVEEE